MNTKNRTRSSFAARDEAPQAYKDIGTVMRHQSDLVEPVRRLLPLVNVKGYETKRRRG